MRIGEAKNWDDLVLACEQAVQRRRQLRRGFERIWWNNIALVVGDHFAEWNPNTATFEDKDPAWTATQDYKKPRLVINHALSLARTELSKMTKSRPVMDVLANSNESTDLAAAKVAESVLEALEWKFKLMKRRKQALWWMIQTGIGAIYVGWDYLNDDAGEFRFVIDPATGSPTFSDRRKAELQRMVRDGELDNITEERFPLGEIEYKVFSGFQLLPDEVATDFDELNDLITEEVVDVDVLKGIYGRVANDVRPDSNLRIGTMEQRMMARSGIVGGIGTDRGSGTVENGGRLFTYWLPPGVYRGNKFLADGIMLRWTHDRKVLQKSKEFPFIDGRVPFVFFQHIPTSTTVWPDCMMSHIRGPNLEIDKTISQLVENKDYMANPMWRVATQHRIKGDIRNVAGSIVRYRHSPNVPPPEPVEGLQMPQQVESILETLHRQMLEIAGQGEIAHGRVPTGVRSGVAVAYLQEEDDTKIAPTIENMEDAISRMGSLSLERCSQYYTVPRLLRYHRRDGTFDVLRFKGADLKDSTDVVCQAGSAMPRMKATRQQYVLELVSLGILTDPDEIQEMLEIGEGAADDTHLSKAQATRENNYMRYGMPASLFHPDQEAVPDHILDKVKTAIPVKTWHDHQIHLKVHRAFMMAEEFDVLAVTHPEIIRLFDEHIAMHEQAVQAAQNQQMQMMLAAKGAPDGPPGTANTSRGVIASTEQPDPIAGGAMGLRTRNRIAPGGAGGNGATPPVPAR